MPVTNLVAYLLIRSRWLISETKFGKHAGIPYSRCGRTKAPYKEEIANCERSWMERLFMKINRLDLFTASMHLAEGENVISV